MILLSVRHFQ